MDFIFMLTRQDQTVSDCLAVMAEIQSIGLKHIGFKDIGADLETLGVLNRMIKDSGATSYMEVVSTTAEAALNSARIAVEIGVDRLLGGTQVQPILQILQGTGISYYPFPGRPEGHPTLLGGSPADIETDCQAFIAAGCAGVDLLAYRATQAQPLDLVTAARRGLGSDGALICAGAVDSSARIAAPGGGIGRACALKFAAEGAAVIVSDICAATAEETAHAITAAGGQAVTAIGDLTDAAACETIFSSGAKVLGGIDILFNNAGIIHPEDAGPVETPLSAWNATLNANLTAVFLACKYGIPHLLAAGGGAIINNASLVALVGSAYPQIAYTAAKGGVLSMTRELAIMYSRQNIRANAICPGPTATPLVNAFMADQAAWDIRRPFMPMGRLGRPEEIANLVAFLASDEASYITGAAYPIDGGISAAYVIKDTPV